MKKTIAIALSAITLLSAPSIADNCGEAPSTVPTVPPGEKATTESIRTARDKVLEYSKSVDAYMSCMDARAALMLPYMSKDQKERWDEDLTNLHNKRRDVQLSLNNAIRAFRRAQRKS